MTSCRRGPSARAPLLDPPQRLAGEPARPLARILELLDEANADLAGHDLVAAGLGIGALAARGLERQLVALDAERALGHVRRSLELALVLGDDVRAVGAEPER